MYHLNDKEKLSDPITGTGTVELPVGQRVKVGEIIDNAEELALDQKTVVIILEEVATTLEKLSVELENVSVTPEKKVYEAFEKLSTAFEKVSMVLEKKVPTTSGKKDHIAFGTKIPIASGKKISIASGKISIASGKISIASGKISITSGKKTSIASGKISITSGKKTSIALKKVPIASEAVDLISVTIPLTRDAQVSSGTDAQVSPGTDAQVSPGTDAQVSPGTDAQVSPGTVAKVSPAGDAEIIRGTLAAVEYARWRRFIKRFYEDTSKNTLDSMPLYEEAADEIDENNESDVELITMSASICLTYLKTIDIEYLMRVYQWRTAMRHVKYNKDRLVPSFDIFEIMFEEFDLEGQNLLPLMIEKASHEYNEATAGRPLNDFDIDDDEHLIPFLVGVGDMFTVFVDFLFAIYLLDLDLREFSKKLLDFLRDLNWESYNELRTGIIDLLQGYQKIARYHPLLMFCNRLPNVKLEFGEVKELDDCIAEDVFFCLYSINDDLQNLQKKRPGNILDYQRKDYMLSLVDLDNAMNSLKKACCESCEAIETDEVIFVGRPLFDVMNEITNALQAAKH